VAGIFDSFLGGIGGPPDLRVVIQCPGCKQNNRVDPLAALGRTPRCGKCKLPIPGAVVREALAKKATP